MTKQNIDDLWGEAMKGKKGKFSHKNLDIYETEQELADIRRRKK